MIPAKSQIQKTLITNDIVEIIPKIPSLGENFFLDLNLIRIPRQQKTMNRICWNRLFTSSTINDKKYMLTLSEVQKDDISNYRSYTCLHSVPIFFLSNRNSVFSSNSKGLFYQNVCKNLKCSKNFVFGVDLSIRLLFFNKTLESLINIIVVFSL